MVVVILLPSSVRTDGALARPVRSALRLRQGCSPTRLRRGQGPFLLEIGSANNSTIVFPIPVDLLQPFLDKPGSKGDS